MWPRPAAAMGDILDRGSLLFASVSAIVAALALRPPLPFYYPLLILAVIYVPGLLGRLGSFGTILQRDYSPLLTCVAMAWTAIQIPIVLARWTSPLPVIQLIGGLAYLYYAVLVFFAVRTVFGVGNGTSAAVTGLSWLPLAAALLLREPLSMIFGLLASPFFLFFAIYYLGSEFRRLADGLRAGQNYRRMLEAAAVNPHDGEAQYQLGLIHQQRRQITEAVRRFESAVAIDPTETDAHFQLARIFRDQGRFDDALRHLLTVLDQNEKHSFSEVHRELGANYLGLGRIPEAVRHLAVYTDRREYDPEGLYLYGQALERLGRTGEARELYVRAVEAAGTAPRYRRGIVAKWSRLAQKAAKRATV
jgi:tetratricopeptide (TPR) repeat protein